MMLDQFKKMSGIVRRLRPLSGALVCCAMLVGCMVGPDYVRPVIDVGTQFKETPGWKVARPAANDPRGPWWTMYRDPVLSALITELNVSNQNVAQAEARFRQAVAVTQGARAPCCPQSLQRQTPHVAAAECPPRAALPSPVTA